MNSMRNIVLNDTHFGVQRASGTTPASAAALRVWQHEQHVALIHQKRFADYNLVYNGDLFDAFMVPLGDAARLAADWTIWLNTHAGEIHLGRGNHDISKDSSRVSMFDFVSEMMQTAYPDRFFIHTGFGWISEKVCILPHCVNQTEFDAALAKILETVTPGAILLLHANYDNEFTEHSDHSLNVSAKQARDFRDRDIHLLFGHEHHARKFPGITITGNQFPTSIADLVESPTKYYAEIDFDKVTVQEMQWAEPLYQEVDWKDIDKLDDLPRFLKIAGTATADDAVSVIDKVTTLRAEASHIFVIVNGVKFSESVEANELVVSGEEIGAVNVLDFLYKNLDDRQVAVVKRLVERHNG